MVIGKHDNWTNKLRRIFPYKKIITYIFWRLSACRKGRVEFERYAFNIAAKEQIYCAGSGQSRILGCPEPFHIVS